MTQKTKHQKLRRSFTERCICILNSLCDYTTLSPTHIMYKSNLSWNEIYRILNYLEKLGHIGKFKEGNNTLYHINVTGLNTLQLYRTLTTKYLPQEAKN